MRFTGKARINGLKPEAVVALLAIERCTRELSSEVFVTSVVNGKHSRTSLHYIGHAIDFDIVPEPSKEIVNQVLYDLKEHLTVEYDVVPEYYEDGSFSHFHIEFQPKTETQHKG